LNLFNLTFLLFFFVCIVLYSIFIIIIIIRLFQDNTDILFIVIIVTIIEGNFGLFIIKQNIEEKNEMMNQKKSIYISCLC